VPHNNTHPSILKQQVKRLPLIGIKAPERQKMISQTKTFLRSQSSLIVCLKSTLNLTKKYPPATTKKGK
jgi:hypothetical protein